MWDYIAFFSFVWFATLMYLVQQTDYFLDRIKQVLSDVYEEAKEEEVEDLRNKTQKETLARNNTMARLKTIQQFLEAHCLSSRFSEGVSVYVQSYCCRKDDDELCVCLVGADDDYPECLFRILLNDTNLVRLQCTPVHREERELIDFVQIMEILQKLKTEGILISKPKFVKQVEAQQSAVEMNTDINFTMNFSHPKQEPTQDSKQGQKTTTPSPMSPPSQSINRPILRRVMMSNSQMEPPLRTSPSGRVNQTQESDTQFFVENTQSPLCGHSTGIQEEPLTNLGATMTNLPSNSSNTTTSLNSVQPPPSTPTHNVPPPPPPLTPPPPPPPTQPKGETVDREKSNWW